MQIVQCREPSAKRADPPDASRPAAGKVCAGGTASLPRAWRRCAARTDRNLCAAPCARAPLDPQGDGDDLHPFAEHVATAVTMALTQLGSAGLLGFCAGIALKRATTEAAYTVGVAFVFLQVALAPRPAPPAAPGSSARAPAKPALSPRDMDPRQVLAHKGYIDVQWKRIRADLLYLVDTDGDGEITRKDVLKHVKNMLNILLYKLPSTAGFTAGLVYGFRWS
jgi:uncharacterized membrane protein (Fun14 family)